MNVDDCNLNINLEDLYHASPTMTQEDFLLYEFYK